MRTTDAKPLAAKIAVVAGATRGAGRGIATMLGEAGATVVCTAAALAGILHCRQARNDRRDCGARDRGGGVGVAIRVDHGPRTKFAHYSSESKGISITSTFWSTTFGAATS